VNWNKIHSDTFETQLGSVEFSVMGTADLDCVQTESSNLKTLAHFIEIIAFDDIKEWVKETNPIENSKGWIVRISKINDEKESLSLQCRLNPKGEHVTAEVDSGEGLDALWIEDQEEVVSIGTEDGEMMKFRAEKEDWMPSRFKEKLGYQSASEFSFTTYVDFGLKTNVPELNKGEKIYFHYLIATNKKSLNKDDISTNLAVDFPKWKLIEGLELD
jgi:hypothetical protein